MAPAEKRVRASSTTTEGATAPDAKKVTPRAAKPAASHSSTVDGSSCRPNLRLHRRRKSRPRPNRRESRRPYRTRLDARLRQLQVCGRSGRCSLLLAALFKLLNIVRSAVRLALQFQ